MTIGMRAITRRAAALLLCAAAPAGAQALASRVAAAGNGLVNFHFAARRGVCGDGERFMRLGRSYQGEWSSGSRTGPCYNGPVQVRLALRESEVERVETWVGTLRTRDGRDLGGVSPGESAEYLLGIVRRGHTSASANAILPAVLADSAVVWPSLLAVARDSENLSHAACQDAAFWLSRFAAAVAEGRGRDLFVDDEQDDEVRDGGEEGLRKHAVFVLSQLPRREGIPALLDIARTNRDRTMRGQALFWLGQSGDARALALFEALLRA